MLPNNQFLKVQSYEFTDIKRFLTNFVLYSNLVISFKLTKKEFFCLYLAAIGMTAEETSKLLCISKDTVDTHRKKVLKKLKSKNMANAVFQAIRYELCIH